MNQFQQFKKLIIKFHQYEAFCVDFVAYLEFFEFYKKNEF